MERNTVDMTYKANTQQLIKEVQNNYSELIEDYLLSPHDKKIEEYTMRVYMNSERLLINYLLNQ